MKRPDSRAERSPFKGFALCVVPLDLGGGDPPTKFKTALDVQPGRYRVFLFSHDSKGIGESLQLI